VSKAPRWVWLDQVHARVQDGQLTSNAVTVAYVLAVRYGNGKAEAWPTQQTLTRSTGLSLTSVHRALAELQEQGLLTVELRGDNRKAGNRYLMCHSDT
jgi:ribonuclease HI